MLWACMAATVFCDWTKVIGAVGRPPKLVSLVVLPDYQCFLKVSEVTLFNMVKINIALR